MQSKDNKELVNERLLHLKKITRHQAPIKCYTRQITPLVALLKACGNTGKIIKLLAYGNRLNYHRIFRYSLLDNNKQLHCYFLTNQENVTNCLKFPSPAIVETFRFEDQNDSSSRFDWKVFRVFSKNRLPGKLYFTFDSPEKLELLSLWKEVTPSSNRKMIKLVTFENLFLPLRRSRQNS